MTDVTLRIRGDATGVIRASEQASRAVAGIADASQQAGAAGRRAGQQIAQGAAQAEQASQRAAQAMQALLASATAAFGTAQIIAAADAYTRMTGALTLATDSAAELATAQQTLFDIAQANRAPIEATVSLYTKLSGALSEAGATSAELASITSTISQAMAISGTSAEAAAGAITQLGQAFASGALRGDEFNSINEAAPRLMQALAASLGVGRGELRALAEQGQLTSDVLARALTGEQARKLAEEFAKLPPTLSQAATVAQNAFTRMVGEADKATGASAALAAGIIRAAELIPQAFAGVVDYFDNFASGFDVAASGFDLLGAEAKRVFRDIGETFLTLPQTLGTVFVVIVAEAELAWTRIAALAKILDATLMQTWLSIKAGALAAFAELALGVAKEFDSVVFALRDSAGVIATAFSAIPGASTAIREASEALQGYEGTYRKLSGTVANGLISIERQRQGWAALAEQTRTTANAQIDAVTAARDASLADLEATRARVTAVREVNIEVAENVTLTGRSTESTAALAEAQRDAAEATRVHAEAMGDLRSASDEFGRIREQLTDALSTPAERAARKFDEARASVDRYRQALGNLGPIDPAQLASIDEVLAGLDRMEQAATDGSAEIAAANQRAAEESARYWSGAAGAISDAFGDFVASGLKSFEDFKSSLKRIAQQIISDLVAQFAQSRITVPIMLGAGFSPAAVAGATGLSPAAVAGAAGGGTGMLGGLLGGIGSAIGGFSAGLGVAGAAGFSAATSFGAASIAAGNFAVGLGALAGALGPVALALGGINALTGGRLFGTSYSPTGVQGTQFNFGEGGATGVSFEEQSRRRSLFRGRRFRTVESPLDEQAQAQIDALFEQVGQAMTAAAAQLGVDVPARISASFRATTDAQGNVISEVGTILGRQYTESFEAFSRRIAAENVIGVLDAALDGEAGRIAEAWRSSADTLTDGAQFLLAAATDLRGGFRLLGDSGLTGVAELVQRLAGDGESLTTAYARIAGATRLLEEVVSLSGVTFDRAREQFVTFAAGVAEAAGGLEEAQRLFQSYFETFYTEQERGLVQLQQARQRAASLASPLGLDLGAFTGTDGAAAFRELFESQLPTLTAEQTAEWLRFAEALGQVLDLQTRYTDAVIETAETIADFMQGIDAALGEFAPAQALTQQLEAQRAANAALIEQATALGASEEQLARVRALGDARIGAIIGSVSQQTATLTAAMRRLGIAASGTAEDLAVAASGISDDFQSLFDDFLGSFYSDAERQALELAEAGQALAQALSAAGLASDELISREQLRAQIESALASGNASLAESLLRVARAMNAVEDATQSATQQLINNANGNQFGGGGGGSGLGFGDPTGGGVGGAGQQLVDTIEDIRRGLREWLQSLTTGDLSPLRPRDQLREARAELARLVQAAQGGDLEALRQLSSAGDTVLRLGQQVFRGADYAALFDEVRALIGGVAGVGSPIGGTGGGTTRPVDDLGESAGRAAAALDGLADRLGMPAGSLTVPTQQFGGVAAQASPEVASRPVVQELQRGRAEAALEGARLRAELAQLREEMSELRREAARQAQELARANDYRRT